VHGGRVGGRDPFAEPGGACLRGLADQLAGAAGIGTAFGSSGDDVERAWAGAVGADGVPDGGDLLGMRGCSLSVALPGAAAGYRIAPSQRAARRSGPGLGNPPPIQIGIRGCCTGRGRQMISLTWKCMPW
jgi:hypothetical protein